MNRDQDRLLSDILAEPGGSGERREALLDRTLRKVKRRRTVRRAQWAGSVLLLLPALALLLWRVHLPQGSGRQVTLSLGRGAGERGKLEWPKAANRQVPYVLVRTAPLPPSALLGTQPFAPSGLVTSAPSLNVASLITRPENRGYREIDDAVLLTLTGTNAAVLVRLGPHSAELLFASGTMAGHSP